MKKRFIVFTLISLIISITAISFADKKIRSYVYTVYGTSLDEMVKTASSNAIKNTTGRFYFINRSILARDILDKYLDNNYKDFISDTEILCSEQIGKKFTAKIRVAVLADKLEKDLDDKKFFYRPKMSPFALVYLNVNRDGKKVDEVQARKIVYTILKDRAIRFVDDSPVDIQSPLNDDVSKNDEKLKRALINAQKNLAEVLISGNVNLKLKQKKNIYYDKYTFYDANADMSIYRVENGELIANITTFGEAASLDPQKAADEALLKALSEATGLIADGFYDKWPKEVQARGDYNLMITNIDRETAKTFIGAFEAASINGKAYMRNFYGNVAIFNILFNGGKDEMLNILTTLDAPHLKIDDVDHANIEAEIIRSSETIQK